MIDNRVTLKDHIRETQLFSSRIIASLAVIILLIVILISRMVYLQIINHQHFTSLSLNNRVSLVPIPPTRGLIFDRKGVVLAQNLPSFTLQLIPEKVPNMDETLASLKKIIELTDDDIERFEKLRKHTSKFKNVPLRFRLSEDEVARFSVRQHKFPGVTIEASLMRHYPLGPLAVHALGYVARINEEELQQLDAANYNGSTHIGKNGVERYYEDVLHGSVGFKRVEANASGRVIRVLEEQRPIPGSNLYLNLDTKVQEVAENALGEHKGAVVAIDPKTGGIIALASMPTYDPNPFVNGIDSKSYNALATSTKQPLFNRAIKGRYPPGSTVKPFVGLAGLETDTIHGNSTVDCHGWYMLKNDDHRYRDWKRGGHGLNVTLADAIRESCDVYFYDLALNLGIDKIYNFLTMFGFGKRSNIDILGETGGLLPSRDWKRRVKGEPWYPGETLITGIGQGFNLASPLQLAVATATLANYGLALKPHVGYAIQSPDDNSLSYIEPTVVNSVPIVKKHNWDYVIEAMMNVVHSNRGTARRIGYDAKYKIAGKTGTAQVFGIKQGEHYVKEDIEMHLRDHALFIAFAPVKDPKIAVAVIVENGGSGAGVAAPIAREVMDEYLLRATNLVKTASAS